MGRVPIVQIAPEVVTTPEVKNPGRVGGVKGFLQRNVPKGTFAAAGSAIGTMIGGPTGTMIGGLAGSALSHIVGFGKYKIMSNTLYKGSAARATFSSGRGVEIAHREFVANLTGSVAFSNRTYRINPGNPQLFPWLSVIAENFAEYEMLGMVVEFIPTSGYVTATSPSLGVVVAATNYNVEEDPFSSKIAMESSEYSNSTLPATPMIHALECKSKSNITNKLYVSRGNAEGTPQLYDLGLLQIGTEGMPSAYVCGEIWVSYHVRLSRPSMLTVARGMSEYICRSVATTGIANITASVTNSLHQVQVFAVSTSVTTLRIRFNSPGTYFVLYYIFSNTTYHYMGQPTASADITMIPWSANTAYANADIAPFAVAASGQFNQFMGATIRVSGSQPALPLTSAGLVLAADYTSTQTLSGVMSGSANDTLISVFVTGVPSKFQYLLTPPLTTQGESKPELKQLISALITEKLEEDGIMVPTKPRRPM